MKQVIRLKFLSILLIAFLILQILVGMCLFSHSLNQVYAINNNWNFTIGSNYTFDSSKIEISSGTAQLKAPDDWYDTNWHYRKPITIDNTNNSNTFTDYPVQISVAYDSDMQADFDDIRFTDADGASLIDDWIESYNASSTAVFWAEVPNIPASSEKTIYMYYGNSGAESSSNGENVFEFFDDFQGVSSILELKADNAASYKISQGGYLAENIVYDSATSKYWWVFEDRAVSPAVIRLAWADDLAGSWTVESNPVISESGISLYSPHIVKFGDYWYIYYGRSSGNIYAQRSSSVNSGYSTEGISNPILDKGGAGAWDENRVMEPYVFKDGATYYLFFMGEDIAHLYEKTGYATSSSPTGGFIKYAGNPVLSGDSPSGWDAGLDKAADPFVFKKDNTFYIGVTAAASGKSNWTVGFFKTTDFITFTEVENNAILGHGAGGSWDDARVLRGAVSEFGGTYYFPYTGHDGSSYRMGMTTLEFNAQGDPAIDTDKWTVIGSPTLADGILTTIGSTNYVKSISSFGQNYALRSRSKLDSSAYSILAFRDYASAQIALEFIGNYPSAGNVKAYQYSTAWTYSNDLADPNVWAVYEIARNSSSSGIYYIDDAQMAELTLELPSMSLPVTFLNNTISDWIAVRKYSSPEPEVSFGGETSVYSLSDPSIEPTAANSITFTSLSGFIETADKDGGEIKYILSNDGGITWQYYNSGWTGSDGTYSQANTAAEINSNIASFPVGAGEFLFRAFFHSNGAQLVQLNKIKLTYINNTPPSASFDNDFSQWNSGHITVNYNLIDPDSDTLNISQTDSSGIEYSTDGLNWYDAVDADGASEGLTNLSSSASHGDDHIFVWDSASDLPGIEDISVYLRIKPNDGTVDADDWVNSNTFGIDNLAPSSVGAPSFGTITPNSITINQPSEVIENGSGLYQWQARRNSAEELGLTNASTTSLIDQGLSENTYYTYDVQFKDNQNNLGAYGEQAGRYTLADTPTNLTASSAVDSITLSVDRFPNDTLGLSGYYFFRQGGVPNSGWIQANTWQDIDLSCNTSYTYYVKYRNADAVETNTISQTQLTNSCPDLTKPIISAVSSAPDSSSAIISWLTNENSSSQIQYGITDSYGSSSQEIDIAPRVSSHSIALSNLISCATYHYRVLSTDANNNQAISSDNTFTTTGCITTATAQAQTVQSIDPDGGQISLNKLSLDVPQEALEESTVFQMHELNAGDVLASIDGPGAQYNIASNNVYELKALINASTTISVFDHPLNISLSYEDSDIADLDESSLRIYRFDGYSWYELSNCVVNTVANLVNCDTDKFSIFALFGQNPLPPEPPQTTGGSVIIQSQNEHKNTEESLNKEIKIETAQKEESTIKKPIDYSHKKVSYTFLKQEPKILAINNVKLKPQTDQTDQRINKHNTKHKSIVPQTKQAIPAVNIPQSYISLKGLIEPITMANISLYRFDKTISRFRLEQRQTVRGGRYIFLQIPEGEYYLVVRAPGFKEWRSKSFLIGENETIFKKSTLNPIQKSSNAWMFLIGLILVPFFGHGFKKGIKKNMPQ